MEIRGRCRGLSIDWETQEIIVTFSTKIPGAELQEQWDKIKGCQDLDIIAKKHRERRSLDANAYFHVLVGKIADELGISKPRCKNILIGRYGQPYLLDDDAPAVIKSNIPASEMLEQEMLHCSCCGCKTEDNGTETLFYRVYRGSHTYDTKEMSMLIDGTVQEAKDMGIETMQPDELERLYSRWVPKD